MRLSSRTPKRTATTGTPNERLDAENPTRLGHGARGYGNVPERHDGNRVPRCLPPRYGAGASDRGFQSTQQCLADACTSVRCFLHRTRRFRSDQRVDERRIGLATSHSPVSKFHPLRERLCRCRQQFAGVGQRLIQDLDRLAHFVLADDERRLQPDHAGVVQRVDNRDDRALGPVDPPTGSVTRAQYREMGDQMALSPSHDAEPARPIDGVADADAGTDERVRRRGHPVVAEHRRGARCRSGRAREPGTACPGRR